MLSRRRMGHTAKRDDTRPALRRASRGLRAVMVRHFGIGQPWRQAARGRMSARAPRRSNDRTLCGLGHRWTHRSRADSGQARIDPSRSSPGGSNVDQAASNWESAMSMVTSLMRMAAPRSELRAPAQNRRHNSADIVKVPSFATLQINPTLSSCFALTHLVLLRHPSL